MVATVHTFVTSSKHVQPDEQLLHLGLQNTGANQVRTMHFFIKYTGLGQLNQTKLSE